MAADLNLIPPILALLAQKPMTSQDIADALGHDDRAVFETLNYMDMAEAQLDYECPLWYIREGLTR